MERKGSLEAPDNLPIGKRDNDITEEAKRFHDIHGERRELREEFKKVTGKSWAKEKKERGEGEGDGEVTEENDLDVLRRAIEEGTIASLPHKEKTSASDQRATHLSESLRGLDAEAGSFGKEHIPGVRAEAKFESKYREVSDELAKLENLHDEMDRQEFELLRLRRGNLNVADRRLLAQFQAVKDSIALREARVRTDVESAPAARLHELQKYRDGLQKYHFAETPSRVKYEDEIAEFINSNRNFILAGPTGTGKTELMKHVTRRLYGCDPEIIACNERTGPTDIFGRTGLRIARATKEQLRVAHADIEVQIEEWKAAHPEEAEEGIAQASDQITALVANNLGVGTETFFQKGPFVRALEKGIPIVFDEYDLLDPKIRLGLKKYLGAKAGEFVTFQDDSNQTFEVKQGFIISGTANLKSTKHKDRFELDAAEKREFDMPNIEYIPKDEMYDVFIAYLKDNKNQLRLLPNDARETLKNLVEAAEDTQLAYLGAGRFFEKDAAATKKKAVLDEAVLEPGQLMKMLSGWGKAEAQGASFSQYIDGQLLSWISKAGYEKDRPLLLRILLSKGFLAWFDPKDFRVAITPEALKAFGFKEKRGSDEIVEVPLRAQEVALLDPFEKRKLELAKIGDEFLDEQFERVPYKEGGKEYKPGSLLKGKDGRVYKYVGLNTEGKPMMTPFEAKKAKTESREEFTALVERETESLHKFFGKDVDVPPVPDSITPEQYEKWREMKFELHYLPAEDMSDSENYPGWKKKPGNKYAGSGIEFLEEAKNSQNSLTPDALQLNGGWVLIDTREKPAYQSGGNQNYADDKFAKAIEELRKAGVVGEKGKKGSRFSITWEELQNTAVKAKFAEILEVSPDQIRLPRAIEWNFLGNAYYQQWGNTNTWEWFEEVYSGSAHLIGGGSGSGGLSSVYWAGAGRRHDHLGFRPLIVFS